MFIERPATLNSISNRKLAFGIAVNDADYIVAPIIDRKQVMCPYYRKWSDMLKRCYSSKYKEQQPTYKGCEVTKEWLTFSNFKAWMINQNWKDKHLDKDLLIQGNKLYSPGTCLFISRSINNLLLDHEAARGDLPQGVTWRKRDKKYTAQCRVNGKNNNLGDYNTDVEAFQAYKRFKYAHIASVANEQSEPLRSALLNYKIELPLK